MELEHVVKVLAIDENLQNEVESLNRQGWQLVPGVQPVAVYHLVRAVHQQKSSSVGGRGRLSIDDAGISVIPSRKN